MKKTHKNQNNKSHDINSGPTFKCNICAFNFTTKREWRPHMKENHKSYKPCEYFIENICGLDEDCKFHYVKHALDEQICNTCGDIFK